MTTTESKLNWLDIQQHVKKDFLAHVSKEELAEIAKTFELEVPGFSKKKLKNAPYIRLKPVISKFLDSLTELKQFFKGYTGSAYEEMEDYDYDTFLLEASLNENMSNTQKLVLLAILFPEQYEQNREQIVANIKNGNEAFLGLQEFSLKDILDVHIKKNESHFQQLLNQFLDHYVRHESLSTPFEFNTFFSNEYEDLDQGQVLQVLNEIDLDESPLSTEERLAFHQLALNELMHISIEQINTQQKDVQEAQDGQQEAEAKVERLSKRKETLSQSIREKEKELKQLKQDHQAEVNKLTKQKDQIADELSKIRATHQKTLEDHAADTFDVIDDQDEFMFITPDHPDNFSKFIPDKMIYTYSTNRSFAEQFKSLPDHKLIFIDTKHVTSKEQMKIQRFLNQKSAPYKFVSGSPEKVFRKIIFYLEGDTTYDSLN